MAWNNSIDELNELVKQLKDIYKIAKTEDINKLFEQIETKIGEIDNELMEEKMGEDL